MDGIADRMLSELRNVIDRSRGRTNGEFVEGTISQIEECGVDRE
jgi:hypothetical protein